jgi:hypothetical protein
MKQATKSIRLEPGFRDGLVLDTPHFSRPDDIIHPGWRWRMLQVKYGFRIGCLSPEAAKEG